MSPNAFQAQQVAASLHNSEAMARIEAEQARQAEALAAIGHQLDAIARRIEELATERPKRSTKP